MYWNNHYFLLQAFDLLGRKLYPDSWTGTEYESREVPSPEELQNVRTPIEREIKEQEAIWEEAEKELKAKLLSVEDREDLVQRIDQARDRSNELIDQLQHIERPGASHESAYRSQQRMIVARDRLYEAFRVNEIEPRFNGSSLIHWDAWLRNEGCQVFLSVSMMTTSPSMSGKRRGSVTVEKVPFDRWLAKVIPLEGSISPEVESALAYTNYLENEIAGGVKNLTRDQYLEVGKKNYGLGANEAKRIWRDTVPADWRKKGRRKEIGSPEQGK